MQTLETWELYGFDPEWKQAWLDLIRRVNAAANAIANLAFADGGRDEDVVLDVQERRVGAIIHYDLAQPLFLEALHLVEAAYARNPEAQPRFKPMGPILLRRPPVQLSTTGIETITVGPLRALLRPFQVIGPAFEPAQFDLGPDECLLTYLDPQRYRPEGEIILSLPPGAPPL